MPIALFLVFTVLTLALKSKVMSTAMFGDRCKHADTSPTEDVIIVRRCRFSP